MSPIAYVRHHPSAGLLFVQLLGVLLYPWMESTQIGRALFGAFGLVVLGLALHVVKRSPTQTWVAVLLAVLVLTLSLVDVLLPSALLEWLIAALEAAFYFYAAASLIAYMTADQHATTDELYAVGATFTLLAWAFAHLYTFCQLLLPGSFAAMIEPQAARTWMELLFLSFTT
ncbi:MAG TPA: two pore domain potassium channel family protein, partial [Pseudomonas sp.]|nr:two pore domain potassium channel family protein [Pseudomonas sp.]